MLDVIGAGFPRTGTLSQKVALERLGFAPCSHMTTIVHDPSRAQPWLDARKRLNRGEAVDWSSVVRDDRASVDAPACLFWRELAAAYPEAKVVLSVRDPERWYESVRDTVYHASGRGPDPARLASAPPEVRDRIEVITGLVRDLFWDGTLDGRFLERGHAISVFEAHNEAVRAELPRERLLVWEASDGWEPLCAFLGVPVPEEPFPRVNSRDEIRERLASLEEDASWQKRGRG